MMKSVFFIFLLVSFASFGNVDHYSLKLDEFTLAKSSHGLFDTIDVTTSAWETSDSLHLYISKCGGSFVGRACKVMARSTENKLFEMFFDNQTHAMTFSISTERIDPSVVKFVALTMGLAPTDNRMGMNYRMGYLRFI